jgi:hypothetical protein
LAMSDDELSTCRCCNSVCCYLFPVQYKNRT